MSKEQRVITGWGEGTVNLVNAALQEGWRITKFSQKVIPSASVHYVFILER
jgi:hypothetical protein